MPSDREKREYLLDRRYERERAYWRDENFKNIAVFLLIVLILVAACGRWALTTVGLHTTPYERVKQTCDRLHGDTSLKKGNFLFDEDKGLCGVTYNGKEYLVPLTDKGNFDKDQVRRERELCTGLSYARFHAESGVCAN